MQQLLRNKGGKLFLALVHALSWHEDEALPLPSGEVRVRG